MFYKTKKKWKHHVIALQNIKRGQFHHTSKINPIYLAENSSSWKRLISVKHKTIKTHQQIQRRRQSGENESQV